MLFDNAWISPWLPDSYLRPGWDPDLMDCFPPRGDGPIQDRVVALHHLCLSV